jgi:hypothetical protein
MGSSQAEVYSSLLNSAGVQAGQALATLFLARSLCLYFASFIRVHKGKGRSLLVGSK